MMIQCRFAGAALIPVIMPALEHLIVDATKESLNDYKIDIWDSESTKIDFPTAPCGINDILVSVTPEEKTFNSRGESDGGIQKVDPLARF
jgi:hypothetical protein